MCHNEPTSQSAIQLMWFLFFLSSLREFKNNNSPFFFKQSIIMSKCEWKFCVHSSHCCAKQRISLSCLIFETSLFYVCCSARFGDAAGRRTNSLLKACLKCLAYGKRRTKMSHLWVVLLLGGGGFCSCEERDHCEGSDDQFTLAESLPEHRRAAINFTTCQIFI